MQRSKMQLESKRQKTQDDQVPEWTETVVSFVFESLGYQVNDTMTSGSSSFRADNLVSLLPAIWGFLNCLSNEESMSLFDAVMSFQKKCQAPTTKKIASDFIIHIYTVSRALYYPFLTTKVYFSGTKYSSLQRKIYHPSWLFFSRRSGGKNPIYYY